jgi:putative NADH-flavin reductase
MKLTVFAATGGIGRQLVAQALHAGHDVTAVVRDPTKLPTTGVRAVTADLNTPAHDALAAAVDGADAILSGLGPRSKSDDGIASRGTRAIVHAMQTTGTRRLVVVSAALVGPMPSPGRPRPPKHDPGDGFFMRHLLGPLATALQRTNITDLAVMEDAVRDSDLDWTIVRPPQLSDKPLTGAYRVAHAQNLRRGLHISRANVAHLMLRTLEQPESIRHVIGISD